MGNEMGTDLKPKKRKGATNKLNPELIFGPASVLPGENSDAYNSLLLDISSKVGPSDIIEEFWVHDVVETMWDMLRLRRYKVRLIETAIPEALKEVLAMIITRIAPSDVPTRAALAHVQEKMLVDWNSHKSQAIKDVESTLDYANLGMDAVEARAFVNQIDVIEQIDRLITNAESRLRRTLNEIDFRRELAYKMRKVVDEFRDHELKTISPDAVTLQENNQY